MAYSDLRGRAFIVTGAASGIGRATALALARQGGLVGLLDLHSCEGLAMEIQNLGGKALSFSVDVTDSQAVEKAVSQTAGQFGKIHGAANLAGWIGKYGWRGRGYALDVIQDDDWDSMLAVNLTGVKNSIKAELRHFADDGGGIVCATSIAGQRGTPWNAGYSSSKAAVTALSKAAAQEVGSRGIRVNAIAPGVIETNMIQELADRDVIDERLISRTALKRIGTAEECADAILFLLSDASRYITSTVLNVDGGYQ